MTENDETLNSIEYTLPETKFYCECVSELNASHRNVPRVIKQSSEVVALEIMVAVK